MTDNILRRFHSAMTNEISYQPETAVDRKVIDAYLPNFAAAVAEEDKPKVNVIDLGCGSGYALEKFKELGFEHVQGITLHREDHTTCKLKELNVTLMDFTNNGIMSGYFNVVWARQFLQYSPFPFLTILEMNRIMRLNGLAYIEVPEPGDHAVYTTLSAQNYRTFLQRAGFEILQQSDFELSAGDLKEKHNFFIVAKRLNVRLPELEDEE